MSSESKADQGKTQGGKPRICGNCDRTDGLFYTTDPLMVKCTISGKYHRRSDECDQIAHTTSQTQGGKPVAKWTLEEAYDYCYAHRREIGAGTFCEETDCLLKKHNVCPAEYVHDWDLAEKPRFTEDEVAVLRYLNGIQGIKSIGRTDGGVLEFVFETEGMWAFPRDMFPSILPGQSITIQEVLNGR